MKMRQAHRIKNQSRAIDAKLTGLGRKVQNMQQALDRKKAEEYAKTGAIGSLLIDSEIAKIKQIIVAEVKERFKVKSTGGFLTTLDDNEARDIELHNV